MPAREGPATPSGPPTHRARWSGTGGDPSSTHFRTKDPTLQPELPGDGLSWLIRLDRRGDPGYDGGMREIEMSSTRQVLEGTWEEIARYGETLAAGQRVRLIVLTPEENGEASPSTAGKGPGAMITLGMFPQLQALTEDDFRAAEFHGDPDDGLDWS